VAVERLPAARDLLAAGTVLLAVGVSLLVGVAVGNQDPGLLVVLGGLVALGVFVTAIFLPRLSFWILLTSTVSIPVFPVTVTRGANPVDVFLLPALVGAYLLVRAPREDAIPGSVRAARDRLGIATLLFLLAAIASLVALAMRGYPGFAADSSLLLFRLVQGLLFYQLARRLLHTTDDLLKARNAIVAGFLIGVAVNVYGLIAQGVQRAGATWSVLVGDHFIGSPNEGGFAVTFLWAIVLAMPYRRRSMIVLMLVSLAYLVATGSRSGLVSWVTFLTVWTAMNRRGWILLLPLALAAIFPFLPEQWSGRLARTIFVQRGSFEIYSTLVRVYAWKTAIIGFQANPLLGVGYLCFRYFSYQYNALTLNLGTAENIILECAVDMGIVGLAALAWLGVSIARLTRATARATARGTVGHELARMSVPFLVADFVANMTANNLVGMVSAAQVAVFCAFLVAGSRYGGAQPAGVSAS
jgi:O-antigen ligase